MLKQGYTKIERIIENVIRDTGFSTEINWVDVVEWVYIASELIGVKNAYVLTNTVIPIEEYRGELPGDFHLVFQVRENVSNIPMRCNGGQFFLSPESRDNLLLADLSYQINHDYIFTSFQEGAVELAYYAFPVDDNGLPLVPDDVMYLRAIEAFITERIARKLMIQNKLDVTKYRMLEQDWLFYVNSARTKDALMTLDQAESLRLQLSKIINSSNIRHNPVFEGTSKLTGPYMEWKQNITSI